MSDDALRTKLEGGEVLLELTRVRYRQLVPALMSRNWQAKLRELSQLARETAADDAQLRVTLARAVRHAEGEKGALASLIREVHEADQQLRRRLGENTLSELVEKVLTTPHRVTRIARLAVLAALLPKSEELDRLATALGNVDAFDGSTEVLDDAWKKVEAVDPSLLKFLREADVLPEGARALIRARRAKEHFDGHVSDVLSVRFVAVKINDGERIHCFRFSRRRAIDGAASLPMNPRNALLMLANELSGQPTERPPLLGGRTRVLELAAHADQQQTDDWKALRAWLRSLKPRRLLPNPTHGPERLVELL
ncbi:MAG: hypothetical protein ACO1OB_17075 [Archangium sp.]